MSAFGPNAFTLETVGTVAAYSLDNFALLRTLGAGVTVAQAFSLVDSDLRALPSESEGCVCYGFAPQGVSLAVEASDGSWPVDSGPLYFMSGSDTSEGVDCFSWGSEGCASDGSFVHAVFSDGAAHPGWWPVD